MNTEIKHPLKYSMYSCKVSWCPICNQHFYNERNTDHTTIATEKHYHIIKQNKMDNKRQDLVSKIFEGVGNAYNISHTKLFPMAAIWMEKVIRTSRETKRRLTENDLICIGNGEIIDCDGPPTHKIKGCEGTLANTELYFILENLSTGEIEKLKV